MTVATAVMAMVMMMAMMAMVMAMAVAVAVAIAVAEPNVERSRPMLGARENARASSQMFTPISLGVILPSPDPFLRLNRSD